MHRSILTLALLFACGSASAAWIYRGSLEDGGTPASGTYDLRITLRDEASGIAVGSPLILHAVEVIDGRFAVEVDFGVELSNVAPLRLQTEVREGSSDFVGLGEPSRFDPKTALGGVCWDTEGNVGTNPAVNFIGTTDTQPLEFRTGNARGLRIEPSAELFNGVPMTVNVIGGSFANEVSAGVRGATIAGGGVPSGDSDPSFAGEIPHQVTDHYGTVTGGFGNQAGDAAGSLSDKSFASVGGGIFNIAGGFSSTVSGGNSGTASGETSVVGGGSVNSAVGVQSTVSGGKNNTASGASSTVAGGLNNTASGVASVVGGGGTNCAGGEQSWAGGNRAKIRLGSLSGAAGAGCAGVASVSQRGDQGTFAWADNQTADFTSTGSNQFLVRAAGGIWLGTDSNVSLFTGRFINTSTGAHLTSGGTWTNASSRALKEGFAAVNPREVLDKLVALSITSWSYKSSTEGRHLGPVAEDFLAAFGLGGDGTSISTVDADGVALAAIQGLNQKLDADNAELRAANASAHAELAELRARMAAIEARLDDAP